MRKKSLIRFPLAAALFLGTAAQVQPVEKSNPENPRTQAHQAMQAGNYKDAYEHYRKLALSPQTLPKDAANDMNKGITCLQSINRVKEIDAFREAVIEAHSDHGETLAAAAHSYYHLNQHHGTIIAGQFERGHHRGGGEYVNARERDRARAMQLMDMALRSALKQNQKIKSPFYFQFATFLMGYRGQAEAWRLQYLTDLSTLPDYDKNPGHYYGGGAQGAPVDEASNPIFHQVPESWDAAASDGERWRWLLDQAGKIDPNSRNQASRQLANFLFHQFGVQTMASYGNYFGRVHEVDEKDQPQTFALHTLKEDETIAKLAIGVKRFTLPDEFNFIRMFKEHKNYHQLAAIFQNRRQYDVAASYFKKAGNRHGADQILKPWGHFEPVTTHPAGKGATIEFRFRNAKKVSFEAHEIKFEKLLADTKSYLKSNPRELDGQKMDIGNIGYYLVQKERTKYRGRKVEAWSQKLTPRSNHFDRRITIETPLKKAGAYLLTAKISGGNTSHVVIWVTDTVIVKKPLNGKNFYFVADAITGRPLKKIPLDFFGYRQIRTKYKKIIGRRYNVLTDQFSARSDGLGRVMPDPKKLHNQNQWLITASNEEGRFAYLGFQGIWYNHRHDQEYNQTKTFVITDRPVYRPEQPVKFKFWVRHAKYDQEDKSAFAGGQFLVHINNPKGEKVFGKSYKADEFGGFDDEFILPDDASLGVYNIYIPGHGNGSSFRVEEYKKPEFEVTIEAPSEPVMLGEKITSTIEAKYYFGAPVVEARIKYKILRSNHRANWYPYGIWDWYYGPGYWWFGYNYHWYPGWRFWGCQRPYYWWWPQQNTPPEIAAQGEAEIGADGTFKLEIDTAIAKEMHGDTDHKYEITAEVTDASRRTIVGRGSVLVARKPFKVYAWVDRGHYRVGDVIQADFNAQTLDKKPVQGPGVLNLYKVSYNEGKPVEHSVQKWALDTDDEGRAQVQIKASESGQYRLSYEVTDTKKHTIEGGYVFTVMGDGFDGKQYRFNEIELIPDQKEYADGDNVQLMVNTDREQGTVVLFIRPANGVYLEPKIIELKGKSVLEEIEISKKDMPNFFVEAFTISGGKIYSETREIIVPPESRVLNVEVEPSKNEYKPGEKLQAKIKLTELDGKPFVGSTAVSVYDKSVEYISGGSNVPEIKAFFWKWRRRHVENTISSLQRFFPNMIPRGKSGMNPLGIFGNQVAEEEGLLGDDTNGITRGLRHFGAGSAGREAKESEIMAFRQDAAMSSKDAVSAPAATLTKYNADQAPVEPVAEPIVRKNFADTAFWVGALTTDENGSAQIEFDLPENLTGWKIRTWAMGHGTKVGEGTSEVVTTKKLLLRLQAPRFFVEKDEVVLSANIHNYLESQKAVKAVLELDGKFLEIMDGQAEQSVEIEAQGEKRVDWRVKVLKEGDAVVRMKALTNEESDAMEMTFPVYVHGMLKTDSFSGVVRPDGDTAAIEIMVPEERRIDESRLEIRYSPTLAGAMVDALPYLVGFPYGCTEQTLNRFLPTVLTQKILRDMDVDLKAVQEKRTNLNAQEIGDDVERAKQWRRWDRNPVFDEKTVNKMVRKGMKRLRAMQLRDGGWGWFSGWKEKSYPHTTAYVVHGLQIAQRNGVKIEPSIIQRGVSWLERHQAQEVTKLKNRGKKNRRPKKEFADNLDAFIYMVLNDADVRNDEMNDFLYRDRTKLAVYGKAMYGLALHRQKQTERRDMLVQNIEQFLVEDAENQTAYLDLRNGGYWWYWYGSEYEAQAYYLKLLAAVDPKSDKAAGLVKYLLNNRKHATYWNSTRDTALCIEAMADYLRATGEDKPDMTVEIHVDGKKMKESRITAENLFTFDNKFVLFGDAVEAGKHKIEVKRKGKGPVYFNAYLTNFTLEDYITKAGLEIKVERKYYKLEEEDKSIKVAGGRGQALDQKVEKYKRIPLKDLATLKSGDLVEIELEIESKNDYEYILFEDMKAAGFEPVSTQSGYGNNAMGAYMELRDERVVFFVRALARGKHSLAYRMRAEIPGRFSALPTKARAMYAPELRANSDEIKLIIED